MDGRRTLQTVPTLPTYSGTAWAPRYFLLQSVAFAAWWAALLLVPRWREPFHPPGTEWTDLLAFALPDLALAVPLGVVPVLTARRAPGWCRATAWACAGAVAYSAAYTVAWAWLRDGAWLAVAAMVPAAALGALFALDLGAGALPVFRRARPRSAAAHLARTLGYTALFWAVFLAAVPLAIAHVERQLGVPAVAFPLRHAVAAVLLAAATAAALWSGATMARHGGGTPLPMDGTTRLVATGPYAWVRNPMMVTGLLQAAAVGLWLGSWGTLAYAAAGGVLWDRVVRPAEERDLAAMLGPEYDEYRRRVRCWLPRIRPRSPPGSP